MNHWGNRKDRKRILTLILCWQMRSLLLQVYTVCSYRFWWLRLFGCFLLLLWALCKYAKSLHWLWKRSVPFSFIGCCTKKQRMFYWPFAAHFCFRPVTGVIPLILIICSYGIPISFYTVFTLLLFSQKAPIGNWQILCGGQKRSLRKYPLGQSVFCVSVLLSGFCPHTVVSCWVKNSGSPGGMRMIFLTAALRKGRSLFQCFCQITVSSAALQRQITDRRNIIICKILKTIKAVSFGGISFCLIIRKLFCKRILLTIKAGYRILDAEELATGEQSWYTVFYTVDWFLLKKSVHSSMM